MKKVTRKTFDEVMVPNYNPQTIIPVSGKGAYVWDQTGQKYIDFTSGIAVNALGHCHPALIDALETQAKKLWHTGNIFTNEPALELAQLLTGLTFAEKVFFCNSGAEANEAALKLARKYAHDHYNHKKHQIISFYSGFHGKSLFTVTVGGKPESRRGFKPVPGGVVHLPFNDIDALKATLSEKTCAVILEPVQGAGGVIPATADFLHAVRHACDQHNALMIFDEIQTGVGRTGKLYAYMHYGVVPDILTTAKALGGGFPVAAMLTTTEIAKSLHFGTHGSTYGGNPLACAVAKAVLKMTDAALLNQVSKRHKFLMQELIRLNKKYHVFKDIRGLGLLIGCELNEQYAGKARFFLQTSIQHNLMLLNAGTDILRITPPLIISDDEIAEGIKRLDATIAEIICH